jgi:hypothetical protein
LLNVCSLRVLVSPERLPLAFLTAVQRPHMTQRMREETLPLLQKKYLTEIDRGSILASITNLRMLCDSTFLLDQQTKVSPKLEELLRYLLFSGPHKVVIFSQWETMLQLAAEVVEKLGVGFAVLRGGIPGKERRGLLERFRDDDDCRVFLSTDAGGTGLNLQAADTVINLEVPWNPAVLEQRIARVHRMGQYRPVQVFNLVMRDSIEERALRTLSLKRSLFAEIFTGTNEDVIFATLGQQAFLDTVRELVDEAKPAEASAAIPADGATATDPHQAVVQAGVQFLEALAALLGERGALAPRVLVRRRRRRMARARRRWRRFWRRMHEGGRCCKCRCRRRRCRNAARQRFGRSCKS